MEPQAVLIKMPEDFTDDILTENDSFFFKNDAAGYCDKGGYYCGGVFSNSSTYNLHDESYAPSSDEVDRAIGILKHRNIKLLIISAASSSAIPWAERIIRPIADKLKALGEEDMAVVLLKSNRWFQYGQGIACSSSESLTPEDIGRIFKEINQKTWKGYKPTI